MFIFYLVKLEDVRDFILDDLYGKYPVYPGDTLILIMLSSHPGIPPCTIPPIDTLTDTTFEYSVLANLLLVRDNASPRCKIAF